LRLGALQGVQGGDARSRVALDLCYAKAHIDTFVIISGDSDFSPLVSKLRENAKTVIGVGVKNSTSDLLMSNCDEFILYDDLVVKHPPARSRAGRAPRAKAQDDAVSKEKTAAKSSDRSQEAIDLVRKTVDALYAERGDTAKLWGSMVKQTLKRRQPSFNESFYGFSSFSDLLEEAQARREFDLELDEKSGGYVIRSIAQKT
jgi:hypothetical protein